MSQVTEPFRVEHKCINSGACRMVAPALFGERDGRSYVMRQPENEPEVTRGVMARVACPVAAIVGGSSDATAPPPFPERLDGAVYYCGYNSPLSFGASSYFVQRPAGNLLVDVPRFDPALVKRLGEMGGISLMFLTHRDDVGEHEKYAAHFGAKRIMHADDIHGKIRGIEIVIEGLKPADVADDLKAIPVPGHTKGSTCLLHKNYLFTGDHLALNSNRGHPTAFNNHCWYSWAEQIVSMRRLAEYDFEWILPGHSGRARYPLREMKGKMAECVAWMESVSAGR